MYCADAGRAPRGARSHHNNVSWFARLRVLRFGLLGFLVALISLPSIGPSHAATDAPAIRPATVQARVASLVPMSATLTRTVGYRQISGAVRWNSVGVQTKAMTVGTLRVLAVESGTNLPTLLSQRNYPAQAATTPTRFTFRWPSAAVDKAMAVGNRIVVTATQHAPTSDLPTPTPVYTTDSYVTVVQVQAGAPRPAGIGTRNCSNRSIAPPVDGLTPMNFDFCDLTGASLTHATLAPAGPPSYFRKANLTGADLTHSLLSHAVLSGSLLAGANASGADLTFASIAGSLAPRFTARATLISNLSAWAARATGANFSQSTLTASSLQGADLRGANFTATTLTNRVILSFADLRAATFTGSYLDAPTMLLTNWAAADLRGATYVPAVSIGADFRWTTLCRTTWFNGSQNNRDCPWPRTRR